MLEYIAFDADDTLWHNENLFLEAEDKFVELLTKYHSEGWIRERLNKVQINNLEYFGYGIKGFMLSMIDTAIELSEGRVSGDEIKVIIELGREMKRGTVDLLDGVRSVLETLSSDYRLMLITKGDLFDQETKLAKSGLDELFANVEVVSDKGEKTYQGILSKHGITAARFLMVGNSLKSDVVPVVKLGGHAVYIPYATTWEHELVSAEELAEMRLSFHQLSSMSELPDLIKNKFR
jgi:putative hydrolase of the HAD superfamily